MRRMAGLRGSVGLALLLAGAAVVAWLALAEGSRGNPPSGSAAAVEPAPTEAGAAAAEAAALAAMPGPEYDEAGKLLRPEGYERWLFAGTSLGITYSEGDEEPQGPGQFHNVYLQPAAWDHFVRAGEFPERTVFVMTNNPAAKKAGPDLINKRGHFAGRTTGLEVAVKDSARFDDGWAYFIFPSVRGPRTAAPAFPRESCYDCHAEHAEVDNVFVQFYSVLEAAREAAKSPARSK